MCNSLIFINFEENLKHFRVMKKSNKTEREIRLEEIVKQQKAEIKRLKERDKYAKETKKELKAELKRVKSERDEEVKKTPVLRKSLNELKEQRWQNLERKIGERFPGETARSVLSELASSFMSGQDADSGE